MIDVNPRSWPKVRQRHPPTRHDQASHRRPTTAPRRRVQDRRHRNNPSPSPLFPQTRLTLTGVPANDNTTHPQITFIGQIRNISTQATNTTYKLDDGTGTIEVKLWTDSDSRLATDTMDSAGSEKPRLVENAYARVWGRLKAFNDKRHVGAHVIRPLADYNEIQYHLLEATYVHLYFTRGPPEQFASGNKGALAGHVGQQQQQQQQDGGGYGDGAGTGVSLSALSMPARRVYQTLRSSPQNNEGLHVQNIAAKLGMQVSEVLKAGDELVGHGKIYTTIDDNTWAILEM